MLKAVELEGFRGIGKGEVGGLEQVNLIVGKNNSGKSSLLEALFLVAREKHVPLRIPSDYMVLKTAHVGLRYLLYRRGDSDLRGLFHGYEEGVIKYRLTLSSGGDLVFYAVPSYDFGLYFLLPSRFIEEGAILTDPCWRGTDGLGYLSFPLEYVEEFLKKRYIPKSECEVLDSLPSWVEKELEVVRSALLIDVFHIIHVKEVLRECWEHLKVRGLDDLVIEALREAYDMDVANVNIRLQVTGWSFYVVDVGTLLGLMA